MSETRQKTSFGFLSNVFVEGKPAESLEFHRSGRPHKHKENEIVSVVSGQGLLNIDGVEIELHQGNIKTVPGNTSHYMRPAGDEVLKLLITYDTE